MSKAMKTEEYLIKIALEFTASSPRLSLFSIHTRIRRFETEIVEGANMKILSIEENTRHRNYIFATLYLIKYYIPSPAKLTWLYLHHFFFNFFSAILNQMIDICSTTSASSVTQSHSTAVDDEHKHTYI